MTSHSIIFFPFDRLFSQFRNAPKKKGLNPNRAIQSNNQAIPKSETSDNAPDYLPYSVYSNLEQLQQKAQEDTIHPVQNPQVIAANPRQPSLKPRKRHSKPLKLTGEVNLGNQFKHERKQRPKERRKPIEQQVNTIDEETVTNAVRHHHHNEIQEEEVTTNKPEIATEAPTENAIVIETSTHQTTADVDDVDKISSVEAKKKLDEKAARRERLKAKLALLTPEERQAFLLMKQQRADAKKKGLLH